MSIFTISPDLLNGIEEDEQVYFTDILFIFTQKNSKYKVAKDRNGEILDRYRGIEKNADTIKVWLEFMSFKPSKFEKVNIELSDIACEETKFFHLCANTKNSKEIIMYSKQNIKKFECHNDIVNYNNISVKVFDRDEAKSLFFESITIQNNYNNSQVANNVSTITDSNNK